MFRAPLFTAFCRPAFAETVDVPGIVPNYTANGADLSGLQVTMVWDFGPFLLPVPD